MSRREARGRSGQGGRGGQGGRRRESSKKVASLQKSHDSFCKVVAASAGCSGGVVLVCAADGQKEITAEPAVAEDVAPPPPPGQGDPNFYKMSVKVAAGSRDAFYFHDENKNSVLDEGEQVYFWVRSAKKANAEADTSMKISRDTLYWSGAEHSAVRTADGIAQLAVAFETKSGANHQATPARSANMAQNMQVFGEDCIVDSYWKDVFSRYWGETDEMRPEEWKKYGVQFDFSFEGASEAKAALAGSTRAQLFGFGSFGRTQPFSDFYGFKNRLCYFSDANGNNVLDDAEKFYFNGPSGQVWETALDEDTEWGGRVEYASGSIGDKTFVSSRGVLHASESWINYLSSPGIADSLLTYLTAS
jgi:hypothetical protein